MGCIRKAFLAEGSGNTFTGQYQVHLWCAAASIQSLLLLSHGLLPCVSVPSHGLPTMTPAMDLGFSPIHYSLVVSNRICKDCIPKTWSLLQEMEVRDSVYLFEEYNFTKNTTIPFSFLAIIL